MTRIRIAVAAAALAGLGAAPSAAQSGGCGVLFNGVAADRIDSINSPLELDTADMVIVTGTDPIGTRSAQVSLYVGPVAIDTGTTTYATPETDFTVTIALDDISPYGVGLFRAEMRTDGCADGAWVRVSGRFPLATLTGLTATGLALGGLTGQLGAIASRRRWTRTAAALGGVATGTGLALVGQQFGRLQVSYVSVGLVVATAAFLGWLLASLLNPAQREQRRHRREGQDASRPEPPQRHGRERRPGPSEGQAVSDAAATSPSPTVPPEPTTPATDTPDAPHEEPTTPEPLPEQPDPETTVAPATSPDPASTATDAYWCYVLATTDVFDLTDHTRTVAALEPGTWYLVKRTIGGWSHVAAGDGVEGWVAQSALNRHG